jgi:hypothetical protein
MLKLYKSVNEKLCYHEAWVSDSMVLEHWGKVGERGETREHPYDSRLDEFEAIISVLKSSADAGFRPVDPDNMATLLIEYAIHGFGTKSDLAKRHELENRMSETLGWTGLGHCDGGSTGSGTMEVCCYVVDFEIAKRVIESDLHGTKYSDFNRIYLEGSDD